MGVRVLIGTYDGIEHKSCMVDSVSGTVFGPLMNGDTDEFLEWLESKDYLGDPRQDARLYGSDELRALYYRFSRELGKQGYV